MAPVLYEETMCILGVRDPDVLALPERAMDAGVAVFHLSNPASGIESTYRGTLFKLVVAGVAPVVCLVRCAHNLMRLDDAGLLMGLVAVFALPNLSHFSIVLLPNPGIGVLYGHPMKRLGR